MNNPGSVCPCVGPTSHANLLQPLPGVRYFTSAVYSEPRKGKITYIHTMLAKQQGEYIHLVTNWSTLPSILQIQLAIIADAAKHLHETKPKRPMRLRKRD